jgi:hypothetical protein
MWRTSHFSFLLVDDMMLPIFFAAMIFNLLFAPSWSAAGDYNWACRLLDQKERKWLRQQLVWCIVDGMHQKADRILLWSLYK